MRETHWRSWFHEEGFEVGTGKDNALTRLAESLMLRCSTSRCTAIKELQSTHEIDPQLIVVMMTVHVGGNGGCGAVRYDYVAVRPGRDRAPGEGAGAQENEAENVSCARR